MNGCGLCLALQSDPGKKRLGCFYKPCYIPLLTERNARFQQPVWQHKNDEVVKHAVYFTPMQNRTATVVLSGTHKQMFQSFAAITVLLQQFRGCMLMDIMIWKGDSTVSRGHKQFSYHTQQLLNRNEINCSCCKSFT